MSIIMDTNPNPNWPNIALPQGRTLRASQAIFGQLKKEAAAVPMADGAAIPATKKRGRNKSANVNVNEEGTAASTKKRGGGRKPKNAGRAAASDQVGDDEEEKIKKKVKVTVEDVDEDEDGMNGESQAA